MNPMEVKMNDLPVLPFEKILGYLSLEDRIKLRAISRKWCQTIDSFRTKSLCYSELSSGFILGKNRLVSGTFAQNFISSNRFQAFFNTFGPTILAKLKHLRLCDLGLENETSLTEVLNSFGQQLVELSIIRLYPRPTKKDFDLNLPMLKSIHLHMAGAQNFTLDAPLLQKIKILSFSLRLNIVHHESVEWFLTNRLVATEMKKLKNLKYLYSADYSPIDPTFLSGLKKLKEIHLVRLEDDYSYVKALFEQKQRYGRADLKIYVFGCLVNGPDDPTISRFNDFSNAFACLTANPSRLANEIPLFCSLRYKETERVDPALAVSIMSRFTDLEAIYLKEPVRDIESFLDLLKSCHNVVELYSERAQPQELLDRLPEYCALQKLAIKGSVSDFGFLFNFRLKGLLHLELGCWFNEELTRKLFGELEIFRLVFYLPTKVQIDRQKQFKISVSGIAADFMYGSSFNHTKQANVPDLNSAFQFIEDNKPEAYYVLR